MESDPPLAHRSQTPTVRPATPHRTSSRAIAASFAASTSMLSGCAAWVALRSSQDDRIVKGVCRLDAGRARSDWRMCDATIIAFNPAQPRSGHGFAPASSACLDPSFISYSSRENRAPSLPAHHFICQTPLEASLKQPGTGNPCLAPRLPTFVLLRSDRQGPGCFTSLQCGPPAGRAVRPASQSSGAAGTPPPRSASRSRCPTARGQG